MKGYMQRLVQGEKLRCGALNRNCNTPLDNGERCKYRFHKGETVCPACGAERRRCRNRASKGANRCKYHGGLNQKHRKYDEYGLPVNFFTDQEVNAMRKDIIAGGTNCHKVVHAVAFTVFKRMVERAEEKYPGDPEAAIFQMCCDYFQKIAGTIKAMEKDKEGGNIVHIHLDDVGSEFYEKRLMDFAAKMVKNILLVTFDAIRSEPNGKGLIKKMKGRLPPAVLSLVNEPEKDAEPAVAK